MYDELECSSDMLNTCSISWKLINENKIQSLSYGEVKEAETLNYRSFKPVSNGILAENIFGPVTDYECGCKKYKGIRYKGVICDRCGVSVESSKVRRERFGHIDLACNIVWPQFLKGNPSILSLVLDMSQPLLMQIIYGSCYVKVSDYWNTDNKNSVILEMNGQRIPEGYMGGADAIAVLLSNLDLEYEIFDLNNAIAEEEGYLSISDKHRLEILKAFQDNEISPCDMVTSKILVLPAGLRPIISHEGKILSADINKKYLSIINRKKRLEKFYETNTPDVIVSFQKRLIQQAVNNLFADGFYTDNKVDNKGFLLNYLKKETRRFVDYSGCSDVLVCYDVDIDTVALPYDVLIELYKPFIISKMMNAGKANNVVAARKKIEKGDSSVYTLIEQFLKNKSILIENSDSKNFVGLRVSISSDKLAHLHPLTYEYLGLKVNSHESINFYVPLSQDAENEVKDLLGLKNNIISSFSGKLQLKPNKALLSCVKKITRMDHDDIHYCISRGEAFLLYDNKLISLNSKLLIRCNTNNGFSYTEKTTLGRIILNECLPQNMGRVNRSSLKNKYLLEFNCEFDEESLMELLDEIFTVFGADYYISVLNKISRLVPVDYFYSDCVTDFNISQPKVNNRTEATAKEFRNYFASLRYDDLQSEIVRIELSYSNKKLIPFYKKILLNKTLGSDIYKDGELILQENEILTRRKLEIIESKEIDSLDIYRFMMVSGIIDRKGYGDRVLKSGLDSLNALIRVLNSLETIGEDRNFLSVIMGREPILLSNNIIQIIRKNEIPENLKRVFKSLLQEDKFLYMDELDRFSHNEQYMFKMYYCHMVIDLAEVDIDSRHVEIWLSLFNNIETLYTDTLMDSIPTMTLDKLAEFAIGGGAIDIFDKSIVTKFGRLPFDRRALYLDNENDDFEITGYEEDSIDYDDLLEEDFDDDLLEEDFDDDFEEDESFDFDEWDFVDD